MSYLCWIFTSPLANVLLNRLMGGVILWAAVGQPAGQTKKAIQPDIM